MDPVTGLPLAFGKAAVPKKSVAESAAKFDSTKRGAVSDG